MGKDTRKSRGRNRRPSFRASSCGALLLLRKDVISGDIHVAYTASVHVYTLVVCDGFDTSWLIHDRKIGKKRGCSRRGYRLMSNQHGARPLRSCALVWGLDRWPVRSWCSLKLAPRSYSERPTIWALALIQLLLQGAPWFKQIIEQWKLGAITAKPTGLMYANGLPARIRASESRRLPRSTYPTDSSRFLRQFQDTPSQRVSRRKPSLLKCLWQPCHAGTSMVSLCTAIVWAER